MNKVVVFDFDGVIVDTVGALYTVYCDFLQEFDVTGSTDEFDQLNGPKLPEIIHYLKSAHQLPGSEGQLLNHYNQKLLQLYATVELCRGVDCALRALHEAGVKLAIASACHRQAIDNVLARFNLTVFFDVIVSGDDVKHAKPDPAIYRTAANAYSGADIFVVEDSHNGLLSAHRAGLLTIHYDPRAVFEHDAGTADYCISDLNSLPSLINRQTEDLLVFEGFKRVRLAQSRDIFCTTSDLDRQVDAIWQKACQHHKLHNSRVLCYAGHDQASDILTVKFQIVDYKYCLAQLEDNGLDLGLCPLAVSGLVIDQDTICLSGIRQSTTEYEGYRECIPAGAIDASLLDSNALLLDSNASLVGSGASLLDPGSLTLDSNTVLSASKPMETYEHVISQQLLAEFKEETGLAPKHLECPTPLGLFFDRVHGVYDLGYLLNYKGQLKQVTPISDNEEYRDLRLIPLESMHTLSSVESWVPTSLALLASAVARRQSSNTSRALGKSAG